MRSSVREVGPSRAVPEVILVAFVLTRVDDRGTLVRCPARPRVPCVGIERAVRPAPTRSHRLRNRHVLFPRFEDQRAERHLFSYATLPPTVAAAPAIVVYFSHSRRVIPMLGVPLSITFSFFRSQTKFHRRT